jgi:hypothetical protein
LQRCDRAGSRIGRVCYQRGIRVSISHLGDGRRAPENNVAE